MSFKIVSTKEKKGVYFCVVPYQWEKDGMLFWPEHLNYSKRESLRCLSTSVPEENWSQFPCILKLSGLENFKDALKMEKQLTECIDTDAEETLFLNITNKKRAATKKNSVITSQLADRNDLFDNLQQQQSASSSDLSNDKHLKIISQQILHPPASTPDGMFLASVPKVGYHVNNNSVPSTPEYKTLFVQNDGSVQMTLQECASLRDEPVVNINHVEIQQIKNEIRGIKNEMTIMKEEIKKDYNKINLNLDRIYKILSEINLLNTSVIDQPPKEDLLQPFSFPLVSCAQIQALDNEIRNNPEFKSQLVTFLSKTGGTSGEEDGGKIAYKIIDQMFHPSVLLNYTWTGVSRGKNSSQKLPFQSLEGIIDVLFQVVSLADSRHTKQKTCNIFKDGVLKYATKRNLRKRSRPGSVPVEKTECTSNEKRVDTELNRNVGNSQEGLDADGEDSE